MRYLIGAFCAFISVALLSELLTVYCIQQTPGALTISVGKQELLVCEKPYKQVSSKDYESIFNWEVGR